MRIAIVNDLLTSIEMLRRVIADVPGYEVAWTAQNGTEAVTKCAIDTPDLILMDLVMPVMDGVEATRCIMAQSPCAILLVTASVNGLAPEVFEAMGYGALDAVRTPTWQPNHPDGIQVLLTKIATIAKLIGKSSKQRLHPALTPLTFSPISLPPLVVVGASTGGPHALAKVLSQFSTGLGIAVVIVQHVDAQFAPGLVDWLNSQVPMPVHLALTGHRPEPGKILVAGTNDHLVMRADLTLGHSLEPKDYSYRPSIDVFFKSVAEHWPRPGIGIVLTGMGRDGATGLAKLRAANWYTITQDQKSSVVYGMPKVAAELGAAMDILPIDAIAAACLTHIAQGHR